MAKLRITDRIAIDENELDERFIHASGPGGQNVNKVASAVQLRFDVAHSPALTDPVRRRLKALAGRRLTGEGVLIVEARRFRSQERNRADAQARLFDLIRRAAVPPVPRRATRPSLAAKRKRLETKRMRGATKQARSRPHED